MKTLLKIYWKFKLDYSWIMNNCLKFLLQLVRDLVSLFEINERIVYFVWISFEINFQSLKEDYLNFIQIIKEKKKI